jgi:hypothetical protein
MSIGTYVVVVVICAEENRICLPYYLFGRVCVFFMGIEDGKKVCPLCWPLSHNAGRSLLVFVVCFFSGFNQVA